MPANVVVIGSLNMDLVTRAPRLPKGGETLIGHSFATVSGGKGANQAVAAARLGARVAMVGCVGNDDYGVQLREALLAEQIDCQAVSTVEDSSGVALIVVDDNSQNAIVIVAGANGAMTPAVIDRFDAVLQAADVIICQLEIPDATVGHALKRARALGKTVILNPAPASRPLPADWFAAIDYLIPNESEASALSGLPVDSLQSAESAANQLIAMGAGKVIITLGAQGSLFANGKGFEHFPAPKVQAVDTTAAGDTFVGGFAAALASGKSEAEAIRYGQVAAALSVTRAGAQPSIPTMSDVQAFKPA
ncbi:ribokinase [Pseudomonas koreensis]|uniref:Ribokinase n=1 Tax=Pseudomonas putida TaxID=303 RepID=A0A2C5V543_PSEPU|nr:MULTISPECIES: ribokinase [Pseudomonas]KAA8740776.1 ribokinase [Pseudomonas koreensis]PHH39679.1 ribokinase [Pseudomonas putida]QBR32800.1 ribokinase [Pseudomonas sp. S150]UZT90981.1 ribokinase [Pseudomonas koreensis]